MRDRLISLVEKADLAIASCAGVISVEGLQPLIESVKAVRTRMAYPEDVLVVALAGGTGSGKSSLLNAIAGEEIAEAGGIRPTTSRAMAAVPADRERALAPLLEAIGIAEWATHDRPGICMVDLPDTDSVVVEHRHRVDALLPLVDVVIWVTDPEKYRDARLHRDYLAPLAADHGSHLFVLNQIDRISPESVDSLVGDFRRALTADGIETPVVLTTAAAPPAGPPIGVEELVAQLQTMAESPVALYQKLLDDVAVTTGRLEDQSGLTLDFDVRAAAAADQAVSQLMVEDIDAATTSLTSALDDFAIEAGGETRVKIERLAGDVPQHMQRIAAQTRPEAGRGWWWRRQSDETGRSEEMRLLVEEAVVRPVRAVLARRAVALATVAELALEVETLRRLRPTVWER